MYYVYGASRPSLLIESTDSTIPRNLVWCLLFTSIPPDLICTPRACARGKTISFVCCLLSVQTRQIWRFRHYCKLHAASVRRKLTKNVSTLPRCRTLATIAINSEFVLASPTWSNYCTTLWAGLSLCFLNAVHSFQSPMSSLWESLLLWFHFLLLINPLWPAIIQCALSGTGINMSLVESHEYRIAGNFGEEF